MAAARTACGAVTCRCACGVPGRFYGIRQEQRGTGPWPAAIFRDSGELAFRQAEHAALLELLAEVKATTPVVAALGGGAFTQPENAELLNAAGALTIFLDAPASELWRRCRSDQELVERPLQKDQKQFGDLYEARRPHYLRASLRVDTAGKDIESIATEIISLLEIDKTQSGPKALR